jgi:hypothetical protein
MDINTVVEIVEASNDISALTKEKIKLLLEKVQTNINILKIRDDVFELYLHSKEIQNFFDDDISDVDILLNVIFDIPDVADYVSKYDQVDDEDEDDKDQSECRNEIIIRELSNINFVSLVNMVISVTSLLFIVNSFFNQN